MLRHVVMNGSVHGYNFAVSGLNEIELDLEVDGAGD